MEQRTITEAEVLKIKHRYEPSAVRTSTSLAEDKAEIVLENI